MKKDNQTSILTLFNFKDHQRQATTRRSPALAVTAGAGSGKTRALVGRCLHLLRKRLPPPLPRFP